MCECGAGGGVCLRMVKIQCPPGISLLALDENPSVSTRPLSQLQPFWPGPGSREARLGQRPLCASRRWERSSSTAVDTLDLPGWSKFLALFKKGDG